MTTPSLKSFEKHLELRRFTPADFDAIIELHEKCFPGMENWRKPQLQSQVDIFPEGQLCIAKDHAAAAGRDQTGYGLGQRGFA